MAASEQRAGPVAVGVDGSPSSIDALRWAARYAAEIHAVLRPVVAWSDFPMRNPNTWSTGTVLGEHVVGANSWAGVVEDEDSGLIDQPITRVAEPSSDREIEARTLLDSAADLVHKDFPHLEIEPRMVYGSPASALILASKDAELLVVGSRRGHGGFTRMLFGSVSMHRMQHVACPVTVVRHAEKEG